MEYCLQPWVSWSFFAKQQSFQLLNCLMIAVLL